MDYYQILSILLNIPGDYTISGYMEEFFSLLPGNFNLDLFLTQFALLALFPENEILRIEEFFITNHGKWYKF